MKRSFFLLLWLGCLAGLPIASAQLVVAKVTATNDPNFGKYKFSVNPALLSSFIMSGASYQVFVNTGDGHYFRGTYLKAGDPIANADLGTFYHPYKIAGQVRPYAEFVEVYDDGNKPRRFYVNPSNPNTPTTVTASTVAPTIPNMGSTVIKLDWVRKVVPTHENTYLVHIKNNSGSLGAYKVEFTYDTNVFDFETNINTGYVTTQNTTTKMLTALIPNLANGAQTSVCFPLKTGLNPNTPSGSVIGPSAKLFKKQGAEYKEVVGGFVRATNIKVEIAHDPNRKTPSVQVVTATNEWIEYRIDFQNDGKGDAERIHISDELDTFLLDKAPVFMGSSHSGQVTTIPIKIAPRTWQWSFEGIRLIGTNATDYTADQEAKTKGWLAFKVQVRQVVPCQAIVNRARIVFGCNSPIYTRFAFVRMNCTDSPICEEGIIPLPLGIPGVPASNLGASIDNLLGTSLTTQLQNINFASYKWYPSTQVTTPFSVSTGVAMARPEVYVLVAAKSCSRLIYYVTVKPANANPYSPILVQDKPGDCVADLSFFGGHPPYSFAWSPPMPPPSTAQPFSTYLDLNGKPTTQITVTDSWGCSVVFAPVKNKCNGTNGQPIQKDPIIIRH